MVEFVGIGDLHLSFSPKQEVHDKFVLKMLKQPFDFARKRGIKDIFLYGDIGEKTWLSRSATRALLRLLREPFVFHIILGNHDKEAEDSAEGHNLMFIADLVAAGKLDNVKLYTEDTLVKFGEAKVNFMPWPSVNFKKNCLNVAHVTVAGTRYKSVIAKDGYSGDCLAVIGHEHDCQRVRNCYYSGTLYQTTFGEAKEKFFHHIIYEDSEFTIRNIPVKPLRVLHTVSSKAELKALRPFLGPNDQVKVSLSAASDLKAEDYADLNVTRVDPSLKLEPVTGSSVELSTTEFFDEWLESQPLGNKDKQALKEFRTNLMKARQ